MRIDLDNQVLQDLEGRNIVSEKDKESLTLKGVCVGALLSNAVSDRADGMEKFKRFELAKRIKATDGFVELTIEELSLIKTMIGLNYITLVVGRSYELLERLCNVVQKKEEEIDE